MYKKNISDIIENDRTTRNFSKAWGREINTQLNMVECLKYINEYKKYRTGKIDYIINPRTGRKIGRGISKETKDRLKHMFEKCIIRWFSNESVKSLKQLNEINKNKVDIKYLPRPPLKSNNFEKNTENTDKRMLKLQQYKSSKSKLSPIIESKESLSSTSSSRSSPRLSSMSSSTSSSRLSSMSSSTSSSRSSPRLSSMSSSTSSFNDVIMIKKSSDEYFKIKKIKKYFGKNYLLVIDNEKSSKDIKGYDLLNIKIFTQKGIKIIDIKIPKIFNKGTSNEKQLYEYSSKNTSSLYDIKDVIKLILIMAKKNKIFYKLGMHIAFKKYSFSYLSLKDYEDFVKLLYTE